MGIRYYFWNDFEFQRTSPTTVEIETLALEIFGEYSAQHFLEELLERSNPSLFVAMDDSNVVGFKAGYALDRTRYYSWLGGVLPRYRRRGIAKELMRRQHQWASSGGYHKLETRAKNRWREMVILNLKAGFDIIGSCTDDNGLTEVIMRKMLIEAHL